MLGRFRSLVMMAEDWRVITEVGVEACTRWRNERGLSERPDFPSPSSSPDFIPTPGLGSFMGLFLFKSGRLGCRVSRMVPMVSGTVAGLRLLPFSLTWLSLMCQTKDSGPDLVRYSVRLSLCYALWHGTGDFGPNMFFDISASPKYMSGLCRTGLAKVIG
ncbi:hypothetical protein Tco_1084272 [Tanacetum coccineum]